MPAVLSALFSGLYALLAKKERYGDSLTSIFPGMEIIKNVTLSEDEHQEFIIGVRFFNKIYFQLYNLEPFQGYGRTAEQQAGFQLMAICLTLGIAIVGGLLTGKLKNLLTLSENLLKLYKKYKKDW